MKTYSESIIPELDGWEGRLAVVLQNVDQNRTIGKQLLKDGRRIDRSARKRTELQIEADFWHRVTIKSVEECWDWIGSTSIDAHGYNYGQFTAKRKHFKTHQFAAKIRYGNFPPNTFVCHHCDRPICCNPSHLFLGDMKRNMTDMILKGRHLLKKRKWRCKISNEAVSDLRRRYGTPSWIGTKAEAEKLGVQPGAVRNIIKRRSRKNIP